MRFGAHTKKASGSAHRVAILIGLLLSLISLPGCRSFSQPTLMPLAALPTRPHATYPDIPQVSPAPASTPALPSPTPAQVYPTGQPSGFSPDVRILFLTPPAPGMRAAEVGGLLAAPVPSAAEILEWRPPPVPVPHSLHPNDHYWLRRPIPSGQVDWELDWYPYGGNGQGRWRVHHGVDFCNDPGTPVLAAGDGVVVSVKDNWTPVLVEETETPDGVAIGPALEAVPTLTLTTTLTITPARRIVEPYGNHVIIRHDWGWMGLPVFTLYGHLLEIFVREGEHVSGGDLIAGVGNTGDSTGPHLHFEVRVGQNDYASTRNPALWLAPYEGWGTLAGRVTTPDGDWLFNASITVHPIDPLGEYEPGDENTRYLTSYASDEVNPDNAWQENFVVPDLPAGEYQLVLSVEGEVLETQVTIWPGATTFIRLHTSASSRRTPTVEP